jgi:hypothetical protein
LANTLFSLPWQAESITLINPTLRIRKILNYRLPAAGKPLQEVLLAGFGVEQKQP